MESVSYRKWLEAIDDLSVAQRREVALIVSGRSSEEEVIAALEGRLLAERVCPRCQTQGAMCRGRANGMRRFHCAGCGKTFNALTGTPLAGLHYKGRWFDFAGSLSESETVRESAKRCSVAIGTAFRWRHRFLRAIKTDRVPLRGIVEADETYVLESRKGSRAWRRADRGEPGALVPERRPRKRGGKATKRGTSDQQTAVLIAADRSGTTLSSILPVDNGACIAEVLGPVLTKDALLVTDAAGAFRVCARALGISHEVLNQSAGERVRGELHIQTVNSRHERFKFMLRRHRGVATKYLGSYLRWFHLAGIRINPSPRACLNAAIGTPELVTA